LLFANKPQLVPQTGKEVVLGLFVPLDKQPFVASLLCLTGDIGVEPI